MHYSLRYDIRRMLGTIKLHYIKQCELTVSCHFPRNSDIKIKITGVHNFRHSSNPNGENLCMLSDET